MGRKCKCGATYETASCLRCGETWTSCPSCAAPGVVAQAMARHEVACAGAEGKARAELVTKGVEYGVRAGRPRGLRGQALGGVAGAALGLLAGHVAKHPDMAPVLRTVRGLQGIAGQIARAIRGAGK